MAVNPIPEYCHHFLYPLIGSRMLELGNKKTGDVSYKSYFESIGFEHVSVDWNGEDGALRLDMRQPLPNWEPFDMVTNFGCTEHVEVQVPIWESIHRLCKVGGVYIGMCPSPGDWWWHGTWYPSQAFYTQYAERNGYEIEHMAIGREHPNRNVDVRMVKVSGVRRFTMPDAETLFCNEMRPR
jgi:SAM-dependent methyltransferase